MINRLVLLGQQRSVDHELTHVLTSEVMRELSSQVMRELDSEVMRELSSQVMRELSSHPPGPVQRNISW